MDPVEWRYLLVGPGGDLGMVDNPTSWIAKTSWTDIYLNFAGLNQIEAFMGIKDDFLKDPEAWKHIYDSNDAH